MLPKSQIRQKTIFFMSIFSLFFCQLMLTTPAFGANADPTPEQIYNAAKIRDGKALQNYKKFINIEDENGQTALCLAQQNKDKYSYEMLLVFGANRDVSCHDDKDPICAIVVGEKLKLTPAGAWILAGTATAGAIAGIAAGTDLYNHHEPCPNAIKPLLIAVQPVPKAGYGKMAVYTTATNAANVPPKNMIPAVQSYTNP